MLDRFKDHLDYNVCRLFFGSIAAFFLLAPLVFTITYVTDTLDERREANSETSEWYVYHSVVPVKNTFERGETLSFNSFVEYKQELSIRWEDTLFCKIKGDGIKKHATQFWGGKNGEKKEPSLVNMEYVDGVLRPIANARDLEFWEYTAEPLDPNAESCYLQGTVIAVTPRGYIKSHFFTTETFDVNR